MPASIKVWAPSSAHTPTSIPIPRSVSSSHSSPNPSSAALAEA